MPWQAIAAAVGRVAAGTAARGTAAKTAGSSLSNRLFTAANVASSLPRNVGQQPAAQPQTKSPSTSSSQSRPIGQLPNG